MPDYDLYALSSRSFEQLVQALAVGIFGPSTAVFGDGPDGGREAVFDVDGFSPGATGTWSGRGVIQAKFRQRRSTRADDALWADEQLSAELRQYSGSNARRQIPAYYIFATNVILTPGTGGGKDKLLKRLDDFVKVNKKWAKGYAVWDYDTLRSLLENNLDVRLAYGAWISTGDLLSELAAALKPDDPDFERILKNFLSKQLLADQYVGLDQAGMPADGVPVARVFVDLPATEQAVSSPQPDEPDGRLSSGVVHRLVALSGEPLAEQSRNGPTRIPSSDTGRVVLIGGPGQGKSTVGQFLAQLHRAALLQTLEDKHTSAVARALELLCECSTAENVALPNARRIPFRVVLSRFAESLANAPVHGRPSLLRWLADEVQHVTQMVFAVEDMRLVLMRHPCLVILDGLDEVPASANRDDVVSAIYDFAVDTHQVGADVMVVATSRPQGYRGEFGQGRYLHLYLSPMSVRRSLHYSDRLSEARFPSDLARAHDMRRQLLQAADDPGTAHLLRTPLQTTILVALVEASGQVPTERWHLFEQYYNVIYQREMRRGIAPSEFLRRHRGDVDAIHRQVGLLLQVRSEDADGVDARLSPDVFSEIVRRRLLAEGNDMVNAERIASQLSEAATERLVFLVGHQAGSLGFELRSLQEYMAAEALMDGPDETVRARLRHIGVVPTWRNVLLFAAGKVFAERTYLRDVLLTLCAELNETNDDPAAAIVLSGSALALEILSEGIARTQPMYAQALARIAARGLDVPYSVGGRSFAGVYDEPLRTVFVSELSARILGVGQRLESSLDCIVELLPQHDEIAKAVLGPALHEPEFNLSALLVRILPRPAPIWLRSTVVSLLEKRGPTAILDALATSTLVIDAEWTVDVERWFGALMKTLREGQDHRLQCAMNDANDKVALNSIRSRQSPVLAEFVERAELPEEWSSLKAVMGFVINRTSGGLALALQALDFEVTLDGLAAAAPWPLASCLLAGADNRDLRRLADRAARGEFGSYPQWIEAELRWARNGVTADDLARTSRSEPVNSNIDREGFPFVAAQLIGPDEMDSVSLSWLLEAFSLSDGGSMTRRAVADLIACSRYEYPGDELSEAGADALASVLIECGPRSGEPSLLRALGDVAPDILFELARRVGEDSDALGSLFIASDEHISLIVSLFGKAGRPGGALRFLAAASADPPFQPSDDIRNTLYDDEAELRQAGLAAMIPSSNSALVTVPEASAILRKSPTQVTAIALAVGVMTADVDPGVRDTVFRALRDSEQTWSMAKGHPVYFAARRSLDLRKVMLRQANIWNELQLPSDLLSILMSNRA